MIKALKEEFNTKDLGILRQFLGTDFKIEEDICVISQEKLIHKVLVEFNMEDCKGVATTMEHHFQATDNISLTVSYGQLIGSLMYITVMSRPDIMFSVSFLSRFIDKPTQQLWNAANRVLRPQHPDSWRFINKDIIPAIGIMAFAFMCHHNTFLIYGSIVEPTQKKWEIVTHASILTSLIVAVLFGVAGYTTFKAYSQGDLLENYCWDDDLMNVSRLLFSVQILLTYPIECFVTREVIEISIIGRDPNVPISQKMHYALTLGIVITTYVISITTYCLGVVLELNGVLAAVPLAYVLPALCYLRLEEGFVLCRKKLPALGVVIFGLTVAILGAIFLILDFDQIDTCFEGKVMEYCNSTRNATIDY
ncbi:hypothetical protein JTB14_033210 [Gonioctena quinquepunctata]|nr:hypothetical protein JTB14_033210 [Gonioctena quinquepunctata]